MKVRDIMKLIEKAGWAMLARTGGGHRQYRHR
jgi:predicted RNA binding protein YcfA (HicA-like mRNA interferase family)